MEDPYMQRPQIKKNCGSVENLLVLPQQQRKRGGSSRNHGSNLSMPVSSKGKNSFSRLPSIDNLSSLDQACQDQADQVYQNRSISRPISIHSETALSGSSGGRNLEVIYHKKFWFIQNIQKLNKKGMKAHSKGNLHVCEESLKEADRQVGMFRTFWYYNQGLLGDMLLDKEAVKCFTLTSSNQGLINKTAGRLSLGIKFYRETLDLEETVHLQLKALLQKKVEEFQELKDRHGDEEEISMKVIEIQDLKQAEEDTKSDMASSNVNLCSLYSAMEKHQIALRFALKANSLLEEIFKKKIANSPQAVDHSEDQNEENCELARLAQVTGTSFYNTGVQYEFLKDYKATLKFYLKGFAFSDRYLGSLHPLTKICQKSFLDAKKKIERHQPKPKEVQLNEEMIDGKINTRLQRQISAHHLKKKLEQQFWEDRKPLNRFQTENMLPVHKPKDFETVEDLQGEGHRANHLFDRIELPQTRFSPRKKMQLLKLKRPTRLQSSKKTSDRADSGARSEVRRISRHNHLGERADEGQPSTSSRPDVRLFSSKRSLPKLNPIETSARKGTVSRSGIQSKNKVYILNQKPSSDISKKDAVARRGQSAIKKYQQLINIRNEGKEKPIEAKQRLDLKELIKKKTTSGAISKETRSPSAFVGPGGKHVGLADQQPFITERQQPLNQDLPYIGSDNGLLQAAEVVHKSRGGGISRNASSRSLRQVNKTASGVLNEQQPYHFGDSMLTVPFDATQTSQDLNRSSADVRHLKPSTTLQDLPRQGSLQDEYYSSPQKGMMTMDSGSSQCNFSTYKQNC